MKLNLEFRDALQSIVIKDLGSSNGTYINSCRLLPEEDYEIKNGDVITLANINYTCVIEDK